LKKKKKKKKGGGKSSIFISFKLGRAVDQGRREKGGKKSRGCCGSGIRLFHEPSHPEQERKRKGRRKTRVFPPPAPRKSSTRQHREGKGKRKKERGVLSRRVCLKPARRAGTRGRKGRRKKKHFFTAPRGRPEVPGRKRGGGKGGKGESARRT